MLKILLRSKEIAKSAKMPASITVLLNSFLKYQNAFLSSVTLLEVQPLDQDLDMHFLPSKSWMFHKHYLHYMSPDSMWQTMKW